MLYICYTPSGCFGAVPRLLQDLDPDDLRLDLVVAHESDVVAQVLFAVELGDPRSVVAQPVLCINSYSHSY